MCGIAGIVTRDGSRPDEGLLQRMSQAIAHRGPDGQGIWTADGVGFAHRRLAIIDLNPTGAQPMHDVHGELTIVFNGEIYNFRELRSELEKSGAKFASSSDTEVILEAYRAWGVECLQKFRGMFAFALWDAPKKRLLIARDRIGKKPLFYGFTPTYDLVFASELKALASVLEFKPDWDAVRLFLGLQYVPAPRTGFQEVMQLEPGEFGVWDQEGWRLSKYFSISPLPPSSRGDIKIKSPPLVEGEAGGGTDSRIRFLLDEAVRIRQLAADVPVGAFLSGGIDSAAVVAFASRHASQPLQTFTMGFSNAKMDERKEAEEIAKKFNTKHSSFEAKPEDLLALLDELVVHYDAPYADSSALPLWLLAKETSKQIKVVLTGDGGDEVFGGYRRYAHFERAQQLASIPGVSATLCAISSLTRNANIQRMAHTVDAFGRSAADAYGELFCGSYFGSTSVREIFQPEFISSTRHEDAVDFVAARIRRNSGNPSKGGETRTTHASSLQAAMYFDLTSYLPDDLNVKMDRATMRWGLEARAPFLDQELVAYASTLPLNQKVHHGKTKIALKRALQGIVPDEVLQRPKRGFQVPLAEWFRGPLRPLLKQRLLDPASPIARIVQPNAVARLIAENDKGIDHGNRLWMLLTLSTWLTRHV